MYIDNISFYEDAIIFETLESSYRVLIDARSEKYASLVNTMNLLIDSWLKDGLDRFLIKAEVMSKVICLCIGLYIVETIDLCTFFTQMPIDDLREKCYQSFSISFLRRVYLEVFYYCTSSKYGWFALVSRSCGIDSSPIYKG